jgi:hypothetical protein
MPTVPFTHPNTHLVKVCVAQVRPAHARIRHVPALLLPSKDQLQQLPDLVVFFARNGHLGLFCLLDADFGLCERRCDKVSDTVTATARDASATEQRKNEAGGLQPNSCGKRPNCAHTGLCLQHRRTVSVDPSPVACFPSASSAPSPCASVWSWSRPCMWDPSATALSEANLS